MGLVAVVTCRAFLGYLAKAGASLAMTSAFLGDVRILLIIGMPLGTVRFASILAGNSLVLANMLASRQWFEMKRIAASMVAADVM